MADGVVSDWEFKITLIDVLRILMGKVDNLQEQMGNGSREMDTVRRKMLEIKRNTVREKNEKEKNKRRKNIPDGLICCIDTVEERISELADRLVETLKAEMQREKKENMEQNIRGL